jgi:hypothetical protein
VIVKSKGSKVYSNLNPANERGKLRFLKGSTGKGASPGI